MKRYGIALLCGLAGVALWWAAGPTPADEPAKPPAPAAPAGTAKDVDLVICLDCSNSMDYLIEAAKQRLWDMVNTLAKAKPAPRLRVAVYSYGNDGYDANAGWVRKELDFSADLDMVFKKLFDLKTNGGSEYVARVCRDALRDLKWSDRPDALKLLFVCGNEAAGQDPLVKLPDVAALAQKQGVVINPIYCGGGDDSDARDWRGLGLLAKGQFANIDQSQRVAVATPFDQKLADLAEKTNATYVPYGKEGGARLDFQKQQTANSAGLGASNLAGRVVTQNSAFYAQEGWDLVDRLKKDKDFDVNKVPVNELPEHLRKLSPQQRTEYVRQKAREREAIQKEVDGLSRQRDVYLREALEKDAKKSAVRFDAVLDRVIRTEAGKKGIDIPK